MQHQVNTVNTFVLNGRYNLEQVNNKIKPIIVKSLMEGTDVYRCGKKEECSTVMHLEF